MSAKAENKHELLDVLTQPEIQQSLIYLLHKLPDIQQSVQSIENIVTFGQSFLQDKETITSLENRLAAYPINAETVEAGITLLGKLPLILQQVELLEQATVFIQDVLGDDQSLQQINESLNSLPVVEQSKEVVELVNKIKANAEIERQETISIFTLMKWLKNPAVQKGLHYAKSALTILGERQTK